MRKSWRMRAAGGITSAMLAITALQPLANVPFAQAVELDSLKVSYNVFEKDGETRSYLQNGEEKTCYIVATMLDDNGEKAWSMQKVKPYEPNQNEKTEFKSLYPKADASDDTVSDGTLWRSRRKCAIAADACNRTEILG